MAPSTAAHITSSNPYHGAPPVPPAGACPFARAGGGLPAPPAQTVGRLSKSQVLSLATECSMLLRCDIRYNAMVLYRAYRNP